jgi:hypothetical protein
MPRRQGVLRGRRQRVVASHTREEQRIIRLCEELIAELTPLKRKK